MESYNLDCLILIIFFLFFNHLKTASDYIAYVLIHCLYCFYLREKCFQNVSPKEVDGAFKLHICLVLI